MRCADRRQAQDSPLPRWVGEQPACVEASHAVTDHVDWLVGKCLEDLLAQSAGALLDSGDRGHAGDEHAVARGGEDVGNRPEVRRERDAAQADPGEAEKAVRQHDGRVQAGDLGRGNIEGAVSIPRLLHAKAIGADGARLDRETRVSLTAQYATHLTFCEQGRHDGTIQ